MLKAVFFDLDGTLLRMDESEFVKGYFSLLVKKMKAYGYDKELLIKTIWDGTELMVTNDGKKTNEEVFWNLFASVYGEEKLKDRPIFDSFYSDEFKEMESYCQDNPLAKEIVSFTHRQGLKTVLSTNPLFPRAGQKTRLSFLGLKDSDFDFVSDYSNSSFCKPNPSYFASLLSLMDLKPEEVILFGNNTLEDGDCASYSHIDTYLVKGYLIHSDKAKGIYPEIGLEDIVPTIQKEMESRA